MPLALFDLDNTLVDRAAAFRRWAHAFAASRGLPDGEVDWLVCTDGDGLVPRAAFFAQVRARHRLVDPLDDLLAAYRVDYLRAIAPVDAGTAGALARLRERGWRIGIVTNGAPTQELKIDAAGLRGLVDGCAISEVVGVRKPDPAIFHAAAARCGCALDGAWVIGDSATADIAGAVACGLRSVWLSRDRAWEEPDFRPDAVAGTIPEAVGHLLRGEAAP
jgi:putative hydrolase of the HAD superfamily